MTWVYLTGAGTKNIAVTNGLSSFVVNQSYSLWFNTSLSTEVMLGHNTFMIMNISNGNVCYRNQNSSSIAESVCSTNIYNDSQWHNVIGTYTKSTGNLSLYVFGMPAVLM